MDRDALLSLGERLAGTADAEEYWKLCHAALERIGVDSVFYGLLPLPGEVATRGLTASILYRSTHPSEWIDQVMKPGLFDHDLSTETLLERCDEVRWSDESLWDGCTVEQRRVADLETELGLHVGASLFLSRPGIDREQAVIGLATAVPADEFDAYWDAYRAAARAVSAMLDAGMRGPQADAIVRLTPREREVLTRLAVGQRPDEIASRLHRARKTIDKGIESAKAKLNARTRDHVVAKAMAMRLIEP